jgi:hypothetical protein
MRTYLIILFAIVFNVYCQQIEEIVECNNVDINQQNLEQMTIKEQEEYVNKFYYVTFD